MCLHGSMDYPEIVSILQLRWWSSYPWLDSALHIEMGLKLEFGVATRADARIVPFNPFNPRSIAFDQSNLLELRLTCWMYVPMCIC